MKDRELDADAYEGDAQEAVEKIRKAAGEIESAARGIRKDAHTWHNYAAAYCDLLSQLLTEKEVDAYLDQTAHKRRWEPGPPSTRVTLEEAGLDLRTIALRLLDRSAGENKESAA